MSPEENHPQNGHRPMHQNNQQLYPHYNGPDIAYAASRQQAPSSNGRVIIIIVLVVIFILIVGISLMLGAPSNGDPISGPIQNATDVEETPAQDESLGLLDDPRFTDTIVAFAQPLDIDGWEKDNNAEGFNTVVYNSTRHSCQIVLQQAYGARQKATAGIVPELSIELLGNDLEALINGQLSYEEVPPLTISTKTPREDIEFFTKQTTYTGLDNVLYRTQIAVQWMDISELSHVTTCANNEWDEQQEDIKDFNNKLTVTWSSL